MSAPSQPCCTDTTGMPVPCQHPPLSTPASPPTLQFLDMVAHINMAAIVHVARGMPSGVCNPTCAELADAILAGMLEAISRNYWRDRYAAAAHLIAPHAQPAPDALRAALDEP